MITILLFVIVLGLLVFIHELGHFLAAKKSGMQVEEFGFGFPPRLLGFQKKSGKWHVIKSNRHTDPEFTTYSINLIPLGGFVRITGENGEEDTLHHSKSFQNKKFFPRLITLAAGVIMNFILAWVITSVGFIVGIPQAVPTTPLPKGVTIQQRQILIGEVVKGSPAEAAGLKIGDIILSVDGTSFTDANSLKDHITGVAGEKINFQVNRPGSGILNLVAVSDHGNNSRGPTGIAPVDFGILKASPFSAPVLAARDVVGQVEVLFIGIQMVFKSGHIIDNLGGPIEIATQTRTAAGMGLPFLLQFTSFLSVNLAVLNSLPIPALDGGRILFLIIEKIRRKRSLNLEKWANAVGFVALILLMLVVTIKDLTKFF